MKEEKKTSKEILSELFDSFNATPPSSPSIHEDQVVNESVKNDETHKQKESTKKKKERDRPKKKKKKEKKSKKKHHDKKSKKKRKKKRRSSPSSSSSPSTVDSDVDKGKSSKNVKKKTHSDSDSCKKSSKKGDKFSDLLKTIKKEKSGRKVIVVNDDLLPGTSSQNIVISLTSNQIKTESITSKEDSKVDISLSNTNDLNSVVLPDVVPTTCKAEQSSNSIEENKPNFSEQDKSQVAEIFVEELLETSLASKPSSTNEKPKVNIKITDLKKINILELAEQKLKEKAEKYEEGEITSDSSELEDEASSFLRPVESDIEDNGLSNEKYQKVKKNSRRKLHKSSQRKRSRSGSYGRKRSHSKDRIKMKRSRSRSRDKRSSSRSKSNKKRRSISLDRKKDKKSHRDSRHRKKERKDDKSDKKDSDRKNNDKEEKKIHLSEQRSKSRERRRNRSKSPLQLPSMIVQDNPNKKRRRSRSRSRGLEIDKKKLLEIARKNALSMLKQQGTTIATVADPAKVATTITAGGKTVDELTDFCKQLSQKEGRDDIELSPITDSSEDENEKAFHHPFLIKDRPSNIVMNIRNSTALPVRTHQEKTAEAAQQLRLQFPVSSGQHHRKTENEWVPVEPKKDEPAAATTPPKQTKGGHPTITAPVDNPKAIEPPPPPPQELVSVFPSVEEPVNINIGDVMGQKLAAVKRLQDNPCDYSALHLLRDAEDKLTKWNETNQLQQPGLFTGSTGARLLTPAELASGQQAWAKKDQLMCAQPVTEGIGKSLLQKMGWKPGEGLGKNHEGTLEPLSLPLKMDKRGLVCAEEVKRPPKFINNNPRNLRKPIIKSLEGKHPVSLLLEYCTKRHFNPPIFTIVYESGPSHKRMFLFKVEVNGVAYQPPNPSNNKKQAKSESALVCLRALGLMPSTTCSDSTT